MKKVLPINMKPYITSECWTYYKFSILQTNKTHRAWLMNFMKVWTDEKGISFFGSPSERNQQSYYRDILDIKDGKLPLCSAESIVEYLINEIDLGCYIILDVNLKKILRSAKEFDLHEILIYGYDIKEKCFYSPLLTNGIFSETLIKFEVLQDAYADVFKYYKEDPNNIFWRRYWTYGIMLLKPKNYIPKTDYYFDFIREIREEKTGCIYQKKDLDNNLDITNEVTWITGIATLVLLNKLFCEAYQNKDYLYEHILDWGKTCLKLCEHQNINLISMKTFEKDFNAEKDLNDIINEYGQCCEEMRRIHLLYLKSSCTGNGDLLLRIADKLFCLYEREKDVLNRFDEPAAQIYIQKHLMM